MTADEIIAWSVLIAILATLAALAPWGCRVYRKQLRDETDDEWWDRQWI